VLQATHISPLRRKPRELSYYTIFHSDVAMSHSKSCAAFGRKKRDISSWSKGATKD